MDAYHSNKQEFHGIVRELKQQSTLRLVLSKIGGIGDTLSTLPILRALENQWDSVEGVFIVDKRMNMEGLLSDQSLRLFEVEKGRGIGGLRQDCKRLKNELSARPDLFLDVTQSARCMAYGLASKARLKIGFKWHFFHKYVFDAAIRRGYTKFEGDTFLDVLRLLRIDGDYLKPSFSPPGIGLEDYQTWKAGREMNSDRPIIVLNPGASVAEKRWDEAKWSYMIDRLSESLMADFIIVEGPAEEGIGERIISGLNTSIEGSIHLNQNRPLEEVAHLVNDASAVVTNDTYLYHMGVVSGCPTFCIFNQTDPFRYRIHEEPHDSFYDLKTAEPEAPPVTTSVTNWLRRLELVGNKIKT